VRTLILNIEIPYDCQKKDEELLIVVFVCLQIA